jgi:hypothetical protein
MLYAILCYHDEDFVGSWSKHQDAAVMEKLRVVQENLSKQGRLGPVARLLPTTAATTLRKENPPVVLDGPYAETKEQLLGFYIVDCKNLDEALDVARELGNANPGGAYEIRPVGTFAPGGKMK